MTAMCMRAQRSKPLMMASDALAHAPAQPSSTCSLMLGGCGACWHARAQDPHDQPAPMLQWHERAFSAQGNPPLMEACSTPCLTGVDRRAAWPHKRYRLVQTMEIAKYARPGWELPGYSCAEAGLTPWLSYRSITRLLREPEWPGPSRPRPQGCRPASSGWAAS